jgi:hypothetical protein
LVYQTVPVGYNYNSAVVNSQRLGGNFAYSVASHPAATAYTYPVVKTVAAPAAVSYTYNNAVHQKTVPLTYASPIAYSSVVAANTPAHTYKTVAGVSPIYYNNYAYGAYGYPHVL